MHVPRPHKSFYRSWDNNCAATNATNGVDRSSASDGDISERPPLLTRAEVSQTVIRPSTAVGLPDHFVPTLEPTKGSDGPIKSYILPGNSTGVVRVLHFCSVFVRDDVLTMRY
jgi:hypothetical protein